MDGSCYPFRYFHCGLRTSINFHWITCFRVPNTITSDCGPQFTSNLWAELCHMLNFSHCQTTAYHPEANSAVKRLHRRLKDALYAHTAMATWVKEIPWVPLGLHFQQRKNTCLSPAEAVFGTPLVLPN
jgi:hypothetical protein